MDDLFENSNIAEPLAARMRPRVIDEFVGQEHIVGPGRLLRRAIAADQISSLIFYGPPGTGKTTLARVIAGSTKSRFITLNAVLSGVADIRREIASAKDLWKFQSQRSILFVDEVHRWNKSQQDALLPWVENGTVILIGATTENPYFEVNRALVSRSRVFQLTRLEEHHLLAIADAALKDRQRGYGCWSVKFESGALEHLVKVSDGDARSLLNALQLAVETTPDVFPLPEGHSIYITTEAAEESIQRKVLLYDKEGDYHFDSISAFIKSLRGSDPDAALYWMAMMIRAGEDPRFIFRRMLISACEDIGLAAPEAIGVVQSCANAFDRVGLPEGQFHLAHACLYLATAEKSNSTLGYFDAVKAVDEEPGRDVPLPLKDANRDKQAFGHGEGYKYPHAWQNHWVAQQYLPDGLVGRVFYRPGRLGYEGQIRDSVMNRRETQIAAMLDEVEWHHEEILTYSPGDAERERWVRRTENNQDSIVLRKREILFSKWKAQRHQRVLIPFDAGGLLLWEAHRRVPEGGVTALCSSASSYDALSWLAGGLPLSERPQLLLGNLNETAILKNLHESDIRFDVLLATNVMRRLADHDAKAILTSVRGLMAPPGRCYLTESIPGAGTCLSDLIPFDALNSSEEEFRAAEASILAELASGMTESLLIKLFTESGWQEIRVDTLEVQEQRLLSGTMLDRWLRPAQEGGYGQRMANVLGQTKWQTTAVAIGNLLKGERVAWTSRFFMITASNGE